jgi:hypothetical protein
MQKKRKKADKEKRRKHARQGRGKNSKGEIYEYSTVHTRTESLETCLGNIKHLNCKQTHINVLEQQKHKQIYKYFYRTEDAKRLVLKFLKAIICFK